MNLQELKTDIAKYQYMEDDSIIDASIASIVANMMRLGDPIWFLIIGASSGGKSQILRPLSMSQPHFVHRVDDLTENTLLSGAKAKEGEEVSLLHKIGSHGIISISDLTVLLSKSPDSRATILSQLRMLYDGEMTKHSGNSSKPIEWKGYLGMIAGSTPSVYKHFEAVADMGERFIYYRMKDIDDRKATELALNRSLYGRELDNKITESYVTYMKGLFDFTSGKDLELPDRMKSHIIEVAMFAERVRTSVSVNWNGEIDRIPVPAKPMRIAIQLRSVALGLLAIRLHDGLKDFTEKDYEVIDWIGYSLSNEENRAILKILASVPYTDGVTTTDISYEIGLSYKISDNICQNLSAVGILRKIGDDPQTSVWKFSGVDNYEIVRRIEHIQDTKQATHRMRTLEEVFEGME